MSSTSGSLSSTPKAVQSSVQSISPAFSQAPSTSGFESSSQRRAGGSGSFGAGLATRAGPVPRNNQTQKKQHRAQKRARLADEDAIAESAAMKSINSRKGQTSITHLMNFSLPPRPYFQTHSHPHNSRYQRRNPTWGLGSGYHAIDKARYVHANYRFIVKPNQDYHDQAVDADVHLEWNSVLQILASAQTQAASCPICLSTPVAPRMAKCGHIFCLPCLIRYMHSTDEENPIPEKRARWKKCPICEDSIYMSEVRPVRWFSGQEASMLREDGDVLLKLVAREPGSTLALPRETAEVLGPHDDIPWYHVAEVIDYARFMKGGEDYMTEQYDAETRELQEQEKEDELMFGEDTTWTRKAVAAITDAKEKMKDIGNPPDASKRLPERKPSKPPLVFEIPPEGTSDMYHIQQGASNARNVDSKSNPGIDTIRMKNLSLADSQQELGQTNHPSGLNQKYIQPTIYASSYSLYFYQALPNFYLSPLDIRILKAAFGPFSSFPSTILPRISHISTGHIIDDDLRKRAKYLAHLPYGCEVNFLECDWTGSVNETVLDQFTAELSRREQRNREKAKREEKERLAAEQRERDQAYAIARRKRPSMSMIGEKSHFSDADFQPLAHSLEHGAMDDPVGGAAISTTPPWSTNRAQSSSFATLATPGTSPEAPRTVWGTAAVLPPTSHESHATPILEPEPPVDDGWLQGWENDLLDRDDDGEDAVAMVEASIAAAGGDERSSQGAGPSRATAGGGGKKKAKGKGKGKKITLMSTNARRGA
ncbi:MAG: hypothetical protein Q9160_006044 [Pyrenula sp. 1 TL-2023]